MNLLGLISGWKGYAAVGGACLLVGAIGGYRYGDAKVDRVLNKINNRTVVQIEKAAAITQQVGQDTVREVEKIRTVTQVIHDEVPHYVPLKGQCSVAPAGFVELYDHAAAGSPLPESPSQPVDAPSRTSWTAVGSTTADNFGACRETRALLIGWQDWAKQQQALAAKGK